MGTGRTAGQDAASPAATSAPAAVPARPHDLPSAQVLRALPAKLMARVTRAGAAMTLSVAGWSLMWAQALDIAPFPPFWVDIAMFVAGLSLIPSLPCRPPRRG